MAEISTDFDDLDLSPPSPEGSRSEVKPVPKRSASVAADDNYKTLVRMRDLLEQIAIGNGKTQDGSMMASATIGQRIEAARAAGMLAIKAVEFYGLPLEGDDDRARQAASDVARRAAARAAHRPVQKPAAWATLPGDPEPKRGGDAE